MPRKKKLDAPPRLVPMPEFQDAMRSVLSKSKKEIDDKMEQFQASNKARRESKKAK